MEDFSRYCKTKAYKIALDQGCRFEEAKAVRVCTFFEQFLTLSSGVDANQPFRLLDWQRFEVIYPLFGMRRPDGKRQFTRSLVSTGKKQGKSCLVAGLGLYLTMADNVDSPLVVLGACSREQAGELFKEVSFSVQNSQRLRDATHIIPSRKVLQFPAANGELRTLSWDVRSKGGWNVSACVLDELALMRDASLYEMLKGSMVARSEPLMILLSNAGYDKSHFYYRDIYTVAKAILADECEDTSFLPVLYEVPEEANWKDKKNWSLSLPSINKVTDVAALEQHYQDALRNKQGEMYWRRFFMNQFTAKKDAWIDLDQWDDCKGNFPPLADLPVYVAADLSSTSDLTNVAAVWPVLGQYYVKSYSFVPKSAVLKRNKMNLKDYEEMCFEGSLKMIDGNCMDYAIVRDCIKAIPGKVQMVVFDKWNALETMQLLQRDGFTVLNFPQTAAFYNEPCKKLDQMVLDRKIVHDGNLCLRWAFNNVQLQTDSKGLVRPSKSSEQTKIDPVCALLMALSQAYLHESRQPVFGKSVYQDRGLFVF